MSHDVRDRLREAARQPTAPVDPDTIHARGRRRQVRARTGMATVAVLALIAGAVSVGGLTGDRTPAPFVEESPATPSPTPGTTPSSPTPASPSDAPSPDAVDVSVSSVGIEGLDRVMAVARDGEEGGNGRIEMLAPDGTTTAVEVGTDRPSTITWFPDREGGIVWHHEPEPSEIVHATVDGEQVLLEQGEASSIRLVGMQDGGAGALVERRIGATPADTTADLLEVPLDGRPPWLLAEDLLEEDTGLIGAAALELRLYAIGTESVQRVVVDRPDTDDLVPVFEGGASTDEYVRGVAMGAGADGFALIETRGGADVPDARLLRIDLQHAEVVEQIDVPVAAGLEATRVVVGALSAGGDLVLVNRAGEEQRWLRPLVLDLRTGQWAELDVDGMVRVGPVPRSPEGPAPACVAEDTELANAAPSDDRLHVYLPCTGQAEPGVVYRHDVGQPASGDVEADARTALAALLSTPDPAWQDRGYHGYGEVGITVNDVTLDGDGGLTVDVALPEDGIGALGTSFAGMAWHTSLLATLFQFPPVESVTLLADGECEDYTMQFESSGCFTADRSQAPWSSEP